MGIYMNTSTIVQKLWNYCKIITGVRRDITNRHTILIGNCIVVSDRIAQLR